MVPRLLAWLLCCALALVASTGAADESEVQIHLITMGPGDHLYTRGGHAALMVARLRNGVPESTEIYNYGDTNWDDPWMVWNFLRGRLVFFLSSSGDLATTVEKYGIGQGRSVYRQRVNLSPQQAREMAERLAEGIKPGQREYLLHHMRAVCSTKVLDMLDGTLGGIIQTQLEPQTGPQTAREYQEFGFSGHHLAAVAADLFLGRMHDHRLDGFKTAAVPWHMRDDLQQIMVPNPTGAGEPVPLVEPPVALVERKEPPVRKQDWFTHYLWGGLICLFLFFGAQAYRRLPRDSASAGEVLFPAALLSGLIGVLILLLVVLSTVREFKANELLLVFPPSDWLLLSPARRWWKGKRGAPRWVRIYGLVRLAVVGLVVIGHLTGLLIQQPRILIGLGLVLALLLWALPRRMARGQRAKPEPPPEQLDEDPAPA